MKAAEIEESLSSLEIGNSLVIGRQPPHIIDSNHERIWVDGFVQSNEKISRQHCLITRTSNGFCVTDSSTNGSYVNGKKLINASQEITNGGRIHLGSYLPPNDERAAFMGGTPDPNEPLSFVIPKPGLSSRDTEKYFIRPDECLAKLNLLLTKNKAVTIEYNPEAKDLFDCYEPSDPLDWRSGMILSIVPNNGDLIASRENNDNIEAIEIIHNDSTPSIKLEPGARVNLNMKSGGVIRFKILGNPHREVFEAKFGKSE